MRVNKTTAIGGLGDDGRFHLDWDWYAGGIPANVQVERDVYIDTSYSFAPCISQATVGVSIGPASGAYDRTTFVVGPRGRIAIGAYCVLNGTSLISNNEVVVGDHCLLAWGSVITDSWSGLGEASVDRRRAVLRALAEDPSRHLQPTGEARPVALEDNTWVGFDAVILPGVTLGRGCIVGSRTVIVTDVAPYAVVAGDPPRVLRFLDPDDTDAQRVTALRDYVRP